MCSGPLDRTCDLRACREGAVLLLPCALLWLSSCGTYALVKPNQEPEGKGAVFCLFVFIFMDLIYNIVLVSGIQQRDSDIYIYIYIYIFFFFFQIIFHYRLLQHIEYCSLCYTENPCCLSSSYIVVCVC